MKDCPSAFSILHGTAFVGRNGSAWDDGCFDGPNRNRNKRVYWNETEFARDMASIIVAFILFHLLGVDISLSLFSARLPTSTYRIPHTIYCIFTLDGKTSLFSNYFIRTKYFCLLSYALHIKSAKKKKKKTANSFPNTNFKSFIIT